MSKIRKLFATGSALMLLAACGQGDGRNGSSDSPATGRPTDASDRSDQSQTDRMTVLVEFATCMRAQGIDYPDPQLGQGGTITMGAGPSQQRGPELDAAMAECDPILENGLGDGLQQDPDEQRRQLENMLAFAKCMRAHGVDYPDPRIVDGRPSSGVGNFEGDPRKFEEAMTACNSGPGGPVIVGEPSDGTSSGR